MPIETGTTISELDQSWPLSGDNIQEGDNHVRLLKAILKDQFPGTAGNGFAKAITATEDQINFLVGVTSSIQDQFDAITQSITDANEAKHPIGSYLFTEVTANPSTYGYPGTWTLQPAGFGIKSATSGAQGVISGNDDVAVPVPKHNHSATFSGDEMGDHKHDSGAGIREGWHGGAFPYGKAGTDTQNDNRGWEHGKHAAGRPWTSSSSAGTPAGDVTVGDAGTDGVTLNVAGKNLTLLVWKRTS